MAGKMKIGMVYTYSTLLVRTLAGVFRAAGVKIAMLVRAKQSWFRRVAAAAAALATVVFVVGGEPRPAAAQYGYDYGYGGGYSVPGYAYSY